ncbi:MAG TPA: HAD-IA family hydrolase [Burkholderiales bacterium]|nr:HAD-IA family hydrolase [Burkholderiales bacterium]
MIPRDHGRFVSGENRAAAARNARYRAVLFDLLTALLDSWSVWDAAAGGAEPGRRWRAAYLRKNYQTGAYRPYEAIVGEAAAESGLAPDATGRLIALWRDIRPWPDVKPVLEEIRASIPIAVVTNCSERLGQLAILATGVPFNSVVTAERAGYYKPDPRTYGLALSELGVDARDCLMVAGSPYDLYGAKATGMDAYWHNRVGLPAPPGMPEPLLESRTLHALPSLIFG